MPPIVSSPSRASVWEWVQAALLIANLAWTTLCLGGYRADTMIVTTGLTAALLVVHLLAGRAADPHPAGWWLLPFLLYAAANVLFVTPVRWLGWLDWLLWAQMVAVFWAVLNGLQSRWPRRAVFLALVALALIGVVLASYQRFLRPDWMMLGHTRTYPMHGRASGSFGIPNSFAGFILLLLPPALALTLRRSATPAARVWWGWVSIALGFGLVLTISRGAWLSFMVAVTLWPLAAARGGWARRFRFAAFTLVMVAVLGAVACWQSPKVRERFATLVAQGGEVTRPYMWRGAWRLFRDAPVTGTGAGSYNVLFERHREEGFRDEPLWAHNEYLNTLSDYGALGFLLGFGAVAAIAMRCVRATRENNERPRDWFGSDTVVSGIGVGLLAFALQMSLDFHLKIPALGLAAATMAGLAVARRWARERIAERKPRGGGAVVAAVGVTALVVFYLPMLRSEAHRQEARRALDRLGAGAPDAAVYAQVLPDARAKLSAATQLNPANAQAWSDRAYAEALWAFANPGESATASHAAEGFATHALAITEVSSEFWIRRGIARDMQGRWGDASKDFTKAVALAPNDALTWYYYADHLSRLKWAKEPAEAALAFCLRLDPGNRAGLALRHRLAINPPH